MLTALQDHLSAEGGNHPATNSVLRGEQGCSCPSEPHMASAQHQCSLDESIPRAADPNSQAAPEQHGDNPTGRRLGGKQDRGYRELPPGAGSKPMIPDVVPGNLQQQPGKRHSKSARSRAKRCLESSSDDCSEGDCCQQQQVGFVPHGPLQTGGSFC